MALMQNVHVHDIVLWNLKIDRFHRPTETTVFPFVATAEEGSEEIERGYGQNFIENVRLDL